MSEGNTVSFQAFNKVLEINKIDIADENIRKTQVKAELEGIKQSIRDRGLIQPIVVIEKPNNRFELLVGQRRFFAYQELGKTHIPALIISDLDPDSRRFVSFAENSFRRELPYDDTIELCNRLFERLAGDKVAKVSKIAQQLNIHPNTVLSYLSYILIPKAVRDLVENDKLTKSEAKKIASAFWPNESRMIQMAKETLQLTRAERDQALRLGKKEPDRPLSEIIEDAKKAGELVRVPLFFDRGTYSTLRQRANHRHSDIQTLISDVIDDWLRRDVD